MEAKDEGAIADVTKRTTDQLTRRIDWIGAARDRSAETLDQIAGKPAIAPATPATGGKGK